MIPHYDNPALTYLRINNNFSKNIIRVKRSYQSLLCILATVFCTIAVCIVQCYAQTDPLPSWNECPAKRAIMGFIQVTTDEKNHSYVAPQDRVAVFDQDGTLWVEHPIYTQGMFALDQVVEHASKHPEWKEKMPFKAVISHDRAAMEKFTKKDLEQIVFATHTGMTTDVFQATVKEWIARAKDPRWKRPYTDLVYEPMLEVMSYLRDNGYKTYIVTGGGQDFVRCYSERVYGVPSEQVIGSAVKTQFGYTNDGNGVLILSPEILLKNNFSGKP